jgi:quercetin 2,3-dioxygenase
MDDGATFEHELQAGANAFLLVLEGSAIVGRQEWPVASGELAWLTRSEEAPSAVTIGANGGATHILLFAGRPLREPVVFGGPFVMNTQEQIDEASPTFAQAGSDDVQQATTGVGHVLRDYRDRDGRPNLGKLLFQRAAR